MEGTLREWTPTSTLVFISTITWIRPVKQTHCIKKRREQTLFVEKNEVFWSPGITPKDLLWLCGCISCYLWSILLVQQHLSSRQEEIASREGQRCSGAASWLAAGGGKKEDGSQAIILDGERRLPPVWHSVGSKQLFQGQTVTPYVSEGAAS